jgi:hypothetical protein
MRKVTILCTLFNLLFTFTANAQSERDSSFTIPADTLDESIGIALEQKADSAIKAEKPIKIKKKRDWTTWKPDPKRAMWLAIILPGDG